MMQTDGTKILYAQPGHNRKPLEVIAQSLDARVDTLDPLVPDPVAGLVQRAQTLADGFQEKAEQAR